MKIEIIAFGKIAEFIDSQKLELWDRTDTEELKTYLEQSFPLLAGMKYKLALNQNIVQSTLALADGDRVAIMPPFSGG